MKREHLFLAIAAVAFTAAACDGAGTDVEPSRAAVMLPTCNGLAATDICVCTDANLGGSCVALDGLSRFFMNLSNFSGLTQFNDTITSIKVGANARGKICADPGGNGSCGYLEPGTTYSDLGAGLGCAGHTCIAGANFGWGCKCLNNTITSIRIDSIFDDCSNPGASNASIFEDPNFNNNMVRPLGTSRDCVVLHGDGAHGSHGYPNPFANAFDLETGGGFGLNTDVVSSVKVGSATNLALHADGQFTGTLVPLGPGSYATLPSSINDKASSMDFYTNP